ncbi:YdeI/OmpD-associated family protein [Flavobacteriaceae bacterium 3-367]|uniref:YdeI/OmpD-associated family protein n=1 Tax=Eudoraea algarum TaxID=3417568 RepID=UPI003291121F
MKNSEKVDTYFAKEGPFKAGMAILRDLAKQTDLEEQCKWGAPVYTINNKNVLGILAFKHHFGLWFYHGVFLNDPKGVLENAQEGKTRGMRHWKFKSVADIDPIVVLSYIKEAIANQKKGMVIKPIRNSTVEVPSLLAEALAKKESLRMAFDALTPYKQKEYSEHIATAKQEKTKKSRLEKILPMIAQGIGLNDSYRT